MKMDTKALKLKVSEALSKDVGRAYARMGPEDLARLGVEVGDIVEVAGKTKAVCKAMPAYKEMRGQSQIQLDGLTRENAGVGLDEHGSDTPDELPRRRAGGAGPDQHCPFRAGYGLHWQPP